VTRLLVLAFLVLALYPLAAAARTPSFGAAVRPLSEQQRDALDGRFWRPGCPVPLSDLRLLTVKHWDFQGRAKAGQLVVNEDVARPLIGVFRQLYEQRFPIRHMRFSELYGPAGGRPRDGDVSGSFECRQAVPSPCTGGTGTGSWSNHAYGLAIDLNPLENPYVGCGASYDPRGRRYLDRSPLEKGMVTPGVVRAFASIGWGWGGSWTGDTKDYMHFSVNGR
jgi:hypothetical protein